MTTVLFYGRFIGFKGNYLYLLLFFAFFLILNFLYLEFYQTLYAHNVSVMKKWWEQYDLINARKGSMERDVGN